MTRKVYIDSFLADAKVAYEECGCEAGKTKNQKLDDTKKAVGEVAAKQVVRKAVTEGYINEAKRLNGRTARRVDPDKIKKQLPVCPPGYTYSRSRKDCIPMTEKDKVSGRLGGNDNGYGGSYNVWGRTGLNGDGYAYEDRPGTDMNATHWDSEVHEAKKTCEPGYEYDSTKKRCVRKRGLGGGSRMYALPYLNYSHHDSDRDDETDGGDSTGGGDAGGAMGESKWYGGALVKEVCTRCARPLIKGKLCKCIAGAKSALYPQLSDVIRDGR